MRFSISSPAEKAWLVFTQPVTTLVTTPHVVRLVGGQFNGHPWGAGGNWAFKLDDPDHVLNQAFDGQGFWHRDEIYQYQRDTYQGPKVLRLLVSLDMNQEGSGRANRRWSPGGAGFLDPKGRRRKSLLHEFWPPRRDFRNPVVLRHLCDGIQYALGDLPADDLPTAEAGKKSPALAPPKPE